MRKIKPVGNETIEGTIDDLDLSLMTEEELQKILDVLMKTDCFDDFEIEIRSDAYNDGCPICEGFNLRREGHCTTCFDCGWSRCSL